MTKRSRSSKSSQATTAWQRLLGVLGALALLIAALIFAVTGVDLTGGKIGITPVGTPVVTQVITVATPAITVAAGTPVTGSVQAITPLTNAVGFSRGFWRVYFTAPVGSNDRSLWRGGMEDVMVEAIGTATRTLDVAAFEWESDKMTQALLAAAERGVKVRMVVDTENALDNPDTTLGEIEAEGIPIVDDKRSAFMHNKFIIIDGLTVWTGSMNYQPNDFFRNNNNVLMLRSLKAAAVYTAEFNEMFLNQQFGVRSPASNTANYVQDGTPIQILFAPENDVMAQIIREVSMAKTQIRFAAFSFTDDALAQAMLDRKQKAGVSVEGIFETTGSQTPYSELTKLYCAGVPAFQDGNPGVLHNKMIIIDNQTVITGSFNFSANAANSNDENLVIIRNADIATLYLQEWQRLRDVATTPSRITCR